MGPGLPGAGLPGLSPKPGRRARDREPGVSVWGLGSEEDEVEEEEEVVVVVACVGLEVKR